jgi:flagellar biosynthesis protein FlhF
MLLDSRPAPPESRHLGAYEVIFALADKESGQETANLPPDRGVSSELSELRRQFERMNEYVLRMGPKSTDDISGVPRSSWGSRAHAALLSHDFTPVFVHEVMSSLSDGAPSDVHAQQVGPSSPALILREIRRRIPMKEDALSHRDISRLPKVVAFIGPPGMGKTSTLVKLAVEYGLRQRKPVQVLSLDVFRVAATEQLRCYCQVLGIGFQAIETPRHIGMALNEHKTKSLVLIDTPGIGAREGDMLQEIAEIFQVYPQIEVHLVLSALVKSADLQNAVDRFSAAKPTCLIATHVDQTISVGGVLSIAATNRLPIAFFGSGQVVPEDIVPARAQFLEGLIDKLGLGDSSTRRSSGQYAERAVAG